MYKFSDDPFAVAFQKVQTTIHENIKKAGFWESVNMGEKLALVHAEVSEALEAIRTEEKPDKHLPHRKNFEVELADILIRCMDLAEYKNIPLGEVVLEKVEYNSGRSYKHGKKF